jgi:hypothetical protein
LKEKEKRINYLLKVKNLFSEGKKRKEKKKKEKQKFNTEFPVINIKNGKYTLLNV